MSENTNNQPTEAEIRFQCLAMAHAAGGKVEEILARAEQYLGFVENHPEGKSPPPLTVHEGGNAGGTD